MKIAAALIALVATASCDAFGVPSKHFAAVRGGERYVNFSMQGNSNK